MKIKLSLQAILLSLFVFFSTSIFAQKEFITLRKNLQITLDSIVSADKFPGATVAAVMPDGQIISLAGSFSDVENQIPMPLGGQMLTGSTGKIFVSAVALQLISEGKFSLDDKVSKYFGEEDWFSRLPNADDLTIRSLMNHTSGLPRYVFADGFLNEIKANPMRTWTPLECLTVIFDMPAGHPVGKGWGYSDTNYILLGMIMEKLTGETFYNLTKNRLLLPLNLQKTYPSTQRELPGLVPGYIGHNNFFGLPKKTVENGLYCMNPQFEWTGGGFVTNTEDMAVLVNRIHSGKVLSSEVYKELVSPVDFRTGQPAEAGYGLGTFVWKTENGDFLGHAGIMPGYLTQVEFSKKYGFSIAFQTNTDESSRKHHAHVQKFAKIIVEHIENQYQTDELAIRENFKKQEECWNRGSIECYMKAYFKSDSIRTISRGGVTYGYDLIESNYLKYYPKDKMGKLHFDQMTLTRLSDEFYYVVGRFNLDYLDRDEPRRGYFSVIMRKIDGEWLMVSDHSS